MPTRKQRRRREKDFRHDMRVFEVDEEGNEVPIAELRTREEKSAKPASKARQQKGGARRPVREVPPPSWQRAFKRGGLMGGALFALLVFVLRSGPLVQRASIGILYAVMFIPFTYWIDRAAYRSYLKRSGKKPV